MDRTIAGRVMMAAGAVLAVVGLVGLVTGGDDETNVAPAATTTVGPTTTTTTVQATTTTVVAETTTEAPTTSTTTTSTTTTTLAPETVEGFLAVFNEAFDTGDVDVLADRLSEATIERYGIDQCTTHLMGILPQPQGLSLRRTVGVGPWDYVTDDVTTSLGDVTALEVDRVVNGETIIQELHWQLADGFYTWFTDCGEPPIID